ncbi:putative phosphonate metabolism protein [Carnobacterium sp. 17-4]|uniref:carbon-phosphorus lyase complex subunit PhnI n=1 Tax=Carnobacterium sp. (strain 17-4) TaxID=208596 RepID=UPI000205921A|nr:carbon-phosphorus lyase complex subunit PhnI [Carnobacterium sp. 17-4]AEB29210.1 putative phosphonate metabolism protein [Carnobacterium sp. 17-4]
MGYVAVKGGQKAIERSNLALDYDRIKDGRVLDVADILAGMRPLVDQVMSESSLYDEELAALAIKQASGSMEEAVFLMRAHRSTLARLYYTNTTSTKSMFVERRISASFKDIPGGQLLGSASDFKQRFLDFDLLNETQEQVRETAENFEKKEFDAPVMNLRQLPKVIDYLEEEGLYTSQPLNDREPDDITKSSIQFPTSRSQRLQSLTRGQTGAVTSLGYAGIRGYGVASHPNIGELRVGELPLHVSDARHPDEEDQAYYIGSIITTEVESFLPIDVTDKDGKTTQSFAVGYGLTFGQNETKTIAMSVLDYSLEHPVDGYPTSDEEFVLLHVDSVESTGFISHLKLPHYVTFQSLLDGIREIKKGGTAE